MAAPNIVNVSTITGKSFYLALSTTSATELVNNPASSGKVFKINMIQSPMWMVLWRVMSRWITHTQDDIGGTAYSLVSTVSVPQDSSLVVVDKNTALYLEEDRLSRHGGYGK